MIRVVGILNVTPDSFHDGGRHGSRERAVDHGLALWEAGADWVDVGGESTRPGAEEVPVDEERRRVSPVVEALVARGVAVSVDTSRTAVAREALAAGAAVINDVRALQAPGMIEAVAEAGAGAVLMHMRGAPATMQREVPPGDPLPEVLTFLAERLARAQAAGIRRIWLDPGLGFGKDLQGNLSLLRGLARVRALGAPVYVGASRKRFIGALTGRERSEDRLFGSIGSALAAVAGGAEVLRVHDVAETRDALAVFCAARGLALSPGRSP